MASDDASLRDLSTCISAGAASPLLSQLSSALTVSPPLSLQEGGFIAEGFSAELDSWRALARRDDSLLQRLQETYAARSGVRVKVKHSDSLGFFVETAATTPLSERQGFLPCQVLKSHLRYKTSELTDLDTRCMQAAGKARQLERSLFEQLKEAVAKEGLLVSRCNAALSVLDVNCGLQRVCRLCGLVRPSVTQGRALSHVIGRFGLATGGSASRGRGDAYDAPATGKDVHP